MNRMLPLAGALVAACATRPPSTPDVSAPAAASATAAPASRTLRDDASYGDLVRAAIALESRSETRSEACLLATREDGFELRAASAPAMRPLPLPASDLDALLRNRDELELLTAWGRYGDGRASVAFATFTEHAPAASAVLLALSDRGIALRGPSGGSVRPRDELAPGAALDAIPVEGERKPLVVVAAESSIALTSVRDLLAGLDARGFATALAVSLSEDTRLPAPAPVKREPPCEEGLPATESPEGALPNEALTSGLSALRDALPDCLTRGDARGAAGGKLVLTFRIGPEGRVTEACLVRDDIGDPGVASCVTELARSLRFTPPSPGGVLDIELPLALRPAVGEGPRALCAL